MGKNNHIHNLMCLDIYLMYDANLKQDTLDDLLILPRGTSHPLMSWDISGKSPCSVIDFHGIKEDLQQLGYLANQFKWKTNVQKLLTLQYEAIILTDFFQEICWVNNGFTEMTGYPAEEAIGKNPKFLQGKNTSQAAKKSIGRNLLSNKTFTKRVLNYRKNKEEYICQLTIFPIYNKNDSITHFLALEVEVEK